jgi:hypothetical protein
MRILFPKALHTLYPRGTLRAKGLPGSACRRFPSSLRRVMVTSFVGEIPRDQGGAYPCTTFFGSKESKETMVSKIATIFTNYCPFSVRPVILRRSQGSETMTTSGNYFVTHDVLDTMAANAANLTNDPYVSPVFQLRSLLGV